MSRASTGRKKRWLSLRHRYDPGLCGWRLVPALQAQAKQLGAHGVAAVPEAACDLPRTAAIGPECFEECNAGGIPHGYSLTPKVQVLTISPPRLWKRRSAGNHLMCKLLIFRSMSELA